MKRFMSLAVSVLALTLSVMAFDCGGGGSTPTPTPRPTKTAIPSPTATVVPTAIPPTVTPVPPTPTITPTPIKPTEDPNMQTYRLAKAVGVCENAYSAAWPFPRHGGILDQFTTKELFDELAGYNIRAVRLWLSVPYNDGFNGPPIYEDMHLVWGHPAIDTMVIIFTDERWTNWVEPGCTSTRVIADVSEPTYEIATFLYENYGDQEKTIIITEPEIDNLWRGYDCSEPNDALWQLWPESNQCRIDKTAAQCAYELSMIRMDEAIARAEKRQVDVERARAEHPNAKLVVASSITVSQFDESPKYFNKFSLRDSIPNMKPSADYIGMSQGASGGRDFAFPIQQVKLFTGYPMDRLFVDQVYVNESTPGKQYSLIKPAIQVAFNWDVQTAFVWMWKQGWISYDSQGRPENKGMWHWLNEIGVPGKAIYGDPTSGLQVIQEMNPGATTPTPIPPTATPRPPTATPTATPTPADPCAHCPALDSWSCQMWPDTCTQCWDACGGGPVGTPTRTPTRTKTPTRTPTGIPPTNTPNPSCDQCPPYGSVGCTVNEPACLQCWMDCGSPIFTPTPTRTPTRTKTPTPIPGDCSHCPSKTGVGCSINYPLCEKCWADCGDPFPTPTPTKTPTITPTPTPHYSDHPLLSINFQGHPASCEVKLIHEDTGVNKTAIVPDCSQLNLTFEKTGIWYVILTAQYKHGWAVDQVEVPPVSPEDAANPMFVGRLQGDLDGDGLYEHRYTCKINVLPRPGAPGPTA